MIGDEDDITWQNLDGWTTLCPVMADIAGEHRRETTG